jgi:hypothetical protein
MPINPNIALQVRPPQFESPVNQLANVLKIQGMQQEQGLNRLRADEYRMKMDDAQRGRERQNKLLSLTQGWGADVTPEQRISGLQGGGFFDEADKLEKGAIERRKAETDMFKGRGEVLTKYLGSVNEYATRVMANPDPMIAEASLNAMEQTAKALGLNEVISDITAQRQILARLTTPEQIKQWAAGHALKADKLLPSIQTRNTGGTTDTLAIDPLSGVGRVTGSVQNTQSPDNAASIAGSAATAEAQIAARGEQGRLDREAAAEQKRLDRLQNQTQFDTRTKEQQRKDDAEGWQYDSDRGILVNKRTGATKPVALPAGTGAGGGAGGGKPLTEGQAKANIFGSRMTESHRILSELEDKGVTNPGLIKGFVEGVAGLTPFMGDKVSDAAGSAINVLPGALGGPSDDQQMVGQARRDFINAVLRRESGAVIAPSEFANADRQYFPQPGDSKAVISQKRRNRETAIRGMEAEMPGGVLRSAPKPPSRESSGKVSDVMSAADRILAGGK